MHCGKTFTRHLNEMVSISDVQLTPDNSITTTTIKIEKAIEFTVPWVPETFSCAVAGFCQGGTGRPSARIEDTRHTCLGPGFALGGKGGKKLAPAARSEEKRLFSLEKVRRGRKKNRRAKRASR